MQDLYGSYERMNIIRSFEAAKRPTFVSSASSAGRRCGRATDRRGRLAARPPIGKVAMDVCGGAASLGRSPGDGTLTGGDHAGGPKPGDRDEPPRQRPQRTEPEPARQAAAADLRFRDPGGCRGAVPGARGRTGARDPLPPEQCRAPDHRLDPRGAGGLWRNRHQPWPPSPIRRSRSSTPSTPSTVR